MSKIIIRFLIISLGVDTFIDDPIGKFLLPNDDFHRPGMAVAQIKSPTLFVMEGGYAIHEIGTNVANVLEAWRNVRLWNTLVPSPLLGVLTL
jgi:acetoin utilization deacetylase AcuC-like enzyme